MFVRWQSRKRTYAKFWSPDLRSVDKWHWDMHWSAVLVESKRVHGKPIQRHVAYLVGFTESAVRVPAQRCHLWDDLCDRLDLLADKITVSDRKKIEAAITKKMPRPTPAEYKRIAYESAVILGGEEWLSERQRTALRR
jgi:hypothetical protein